MSLSACKTFATLASKVLRATTPVSNAALRSKLPVFLSRGLQTQRSFTRSMWCLTGGAGRRADDGLTAGAKWTATTKPCGCCNLHTQGDQELVGFIGEEINHEKKTQTDSLPSIKGFTMKTDGTLITLVKQAEGETLTIEINVNHSVEDADEEFEGKEQPTAEMVSRPPFIVKFNKGSDTTLGIQCDFPAQDDGPPAAENEEYVQRSLYRSVEVLREEHSWCYLVVQAISRALGGKFTVDAIEITEVAVLKGCDWEDKIYSVSGSVMDGTLYDMLMNMMEERGIDGTFVEEMVELCTAYDHKLYINFLENLRGFAAEK